MILNVYSKPFKVKSEQWKFNRKFTRHVVKVEKTRFWTASHSFYASVLRVKADIIAILKIFAIA